FEGSGGGAGFAEGDAGGVAAFSAERFSEVAAGAIGFSVGASGTVSGCCAGLGVSVFGCAPLDESAKSPFRATARSNAPRERHAPATPIAATTTSAAKGI